MYMDSSQPPSLKALKERMEAQPRSFSFFQVMRLLNGMQVGRKDGEPLPPVRVRPRLSLSFPSSQVDRVVFPEADAEHPSIEVTSNILCLYGTDSPLPTFYTEQLIEQEQDDNRNLRDVLDVVNLRLYELLYKGWHKYRMMERMLEACDDRGADRLFNLAGLNEKILKKQFSEPRRLIRYLSLFSLKNRPAAGLQAMLSEALGNLPVRVVQAVQYTGIIPTDQRSRLGSTMRLGERSNIGQEFRSNSSSIRIEIGPVSEEVYRRFFPGMKEYEYLVSLTRVYLSSPATFQIELILARGVNPCGVQLGDRTGGRIGLDSWLGTDGESAAVEVENRVRFSPV